MEGTFIFLGTGASTGVPIIGCHCAVCTSKVSQNHRLRTSGLIQAKGKNFLIDAGPDFRQQGLKERLERLDGLLLTHTHYDHIAGIDELRIYNVRTKRPVPCLLSRRSFVDIQKRYYYFFEPSEESAAQFTFQILEKDQGIVDFEGVLFSYLTYSQQTMRVNGYRLGEFAYVSDIREYDESVFSALANVKKLVLGALRWESSQVHFTVDEAIAFAKRVGASHTYLTHLSHHIDYEAASQKLPPGIHLGVDGLKIQFSF